MQVSTIILTFLFLDNTALEGGAIRCGLTCNLTLTNTQFRSNLAATGGALQLERNSRLRGDNLRMHDNKAIIQGGAINIL
jgi:predicted outer membrane repeat protein